MEKIILAAASSFNRKFYFEPDFSELPEEIKKDIQIVCVSIAERVHGIFTMGFYEDGSMFLEASGDELNFDEIGAALEVERLKKDKKDLINSLTLWYKVWSMVEYS